jgi:hypothetical protein
MKENNKFILPLNLQHFAEGGDPPAEPPKDPIDPPAEPPKTFTQADFDREISKMYEKFEEKFNKRAEQTKAEATKLATMNAEERLKYEIEQREKAIQDKEREWTLKENKYECSKILSEKGLPIAFAEYIVAEDAETMNKNIQLFDAEFKKAVKLEVESRLKSSTPKTSTIGLDGQITKDQFNKMSVSQQNELYLNNKELYLQLSK